MKWVTAALFVVAAVLGGLLLTRGQAGRAALGGETLGAPRPLPTVALLDDRGRPATLAQGDGRLRLVFYGFVRCPDVCPATLAAIKNGYAALSPEQRARVRVQLVSVDPTFDRPAVLRAYLNRFDSAFTGLTGTTEAVNTAAREMFVSIVDTSDPNAHAAHGTSATSSATFQHGDQVSVVDAQNRMVRIYENGAVVDGTLGRDLPALIRQYGS